MIKDILRVALRGEMPTSDGWTRTAALAAGLVVLVGLELVEAPVGLALLAARVLDTPPEPGGHAPEQRTA
jgi:hypothetical protein